MNILQQVVIEIASFTRLEHPDAWSIVIEEIASDYQHGGGFSVSYLQHDYSQYLDCLAASDMREAKAEAKELVIQDLARLKESS